MESAGINETLSRISEVLNELRYSCDRLAEWPLPPDPTIVGAWAPFLKESLNRIDKTLSEIHRRLDAHLSPIHARRQGGFAPGTAMAEVERIHIIQTLDMVHGNRDRAAKLLAIGARTLYRKLNAYGLR